MAALHFAAVRAILKGKVYTIGENLAVEEADTVTPLVAGETSYRHKNPEKVCLRVLAAAAEIYEFCPAAS